jgi:hypothetical protein
MDVLIWILGVAVVLAIIGAAAQALGTDSRPDFGDRHPTER